MRVCPEPKAERRPDSETGGSTRRLPRLHPLTHLPPRATLGLRPSHPFKRAGLRLRPGLPLRDRRLPLRPLELGLVLERVLHALLELREGRLARLELVV